MILNSGKRKLKNKTRKTLFKPIVLLLKFVMAIAVLTTLVVLMVDESKSTNGGGGDKVYTNLSASPENDSGLYPDNSDGTLNGLNLLLLNSIKTEGWVSELLNLYLDAENGKVSDSQFTLPLYGYMGIQLNESNALAGFLPKTYLPLKDGNFVWKESWNGIPAEQVTIKNFTADNGALVANTFDEIPYLGASGYYGLFQNEVISYESKSSINPESQDSSRKSSIFYMPDCIAYINDRVSDFVNGSYLKYTGEVDKDVLAVIAASIHNAGQTGAAFPLAWGSYPSNSLAVSMVWSPYSDVVYNAYKSLTEDFISSFNKNTKAGSQIYYPDTSRIVGAYFLCEAGWFLDDTGNSYVHSASGVTDTVASYLLGEGKTRSDLLSYFDSKTKALPISDSEARNLYNWESASESFISYHKGGIYKYTPNESQSLPTGVTAPKLSVTNLESTGQMYMALIGAKVYYATSLKFAGVEGVDPTNPSTYLNTISDGEWKPSGDTEWTKDWGIDLSKVSDKRRSILNTAAKFLGSIYAWGGTTPPVQNADGTWQAPVGTGNWIGGYETKYPGFDCSGYTQYCIREGAGISIGRTTWNQMEDSNFEHVSSYDQLQPGDLLITAGGAHVEFYLGKDSTTGKIIIMHAPDEDLPLTIEYRDPSRSITAFLHLKGVD